jgi:endonuclease-3
MKKKNLIDDGRIPEVIDILRRMHPDAMCALDHRDNFQLLVAVVLSAQTTDVSVNQVTPDLFKAYPGPAELGEAKPEDVENYIKRIGMYHQKAKNIVGLSKRICEDFDGKVPQDRTKLESLPGVGRKTANVVLSVGFGEQHIAVDTHVFRVSNRIGLVHEKDVEHTEMSLMKKLPGDRLTEAHHSLIFHGRYCCHARKPECERCCIAELCQKNRERQELEQAIWDQSVKMLSDHVPGTPVVLAYEGWHPGVIGIVASRLMDAYSVPAVMICLDGDAGKGSCRSIGGFNLYEALTACSDLLEGFGGHAMAAGLTVRRENIDELRRRLTEYYVTHPTVYVHALEPDLRITDPALLSMQCVESLDELEPCGNANPRPLLYMDNALLSQVTPIGGGKHLRLRVDQFEQSYDCVFFGQTEKNLGARRGQRVDIAFAPQINEFRGHRSVQLVITDLRPHEE